MELSIKMNTGKRESDEDLPAAKRPRCVPLDHRACWTRTPAAAKIYSEGQAHRQFCTDNNNEALYRFLDYMEVQLRLQAQETEQLKKASRRAKCWRLNHCKFCRENYRIECELCGGLWPDYQLGSACCNDCKRLQDTGGGDKTLLCEDCAGSREAYGRAPAYCDICQCEHCEECKCIGAPS